MNTIAALIMGAAAAALVTALLGLAIIPWLRKLHFGQTILDIGPKWHEKKQGTPTMGGLMFIFGTIAAIAVTVITDSSSAAISLPAAQPARRQRNFIRSSTAALSLLSAWRSSALPMTI